MCGIACIVSMKDPVVTSDLQRMASCIAHRGPDENGFCILEEGKIGFVHTRLSIIDIAQGIQPLSSADGRVVITFNGEIYDHAPIREDLIKKGYKFNTQTDTEVIVNLYLEYGDNFLSHLNGEFSFILYDKKYKKLLACRDRFGIKPLFYTQQANEIVFCSEVKGIFGLPRIPRNLSHTYITTSFIGIFPPEDCAFENIHSLRPGHYIVIENNLLTEKCYWEFPLHDNPIKIKREEAIEELQYRLRRAIKRRLVADVPVGVYLSGGIDSSIISSYAAKESPLIDNFTVQFEGHQYDESRFAKLMSQHANIRLHTLNANNIEIVRHIKRAVYHSEIPISNAASAARLMLSEFVKANGYKVCLTGEGADELMAGYPFFKSEMLRTLMLRRKDNPKQYLIKKYKQFKKEEQLSAARLWTADEEWKHINFLLGYANNFEHRAILYTGTKVDFFNHSRGIASRILNLNNFTSANINKVLPEFYTWYPPEKFVGVNPLKISRLFAFSQFCCAVVPELGDRMEMANGVECRLPFLDNDVSEFCFSLPNHLLLYLPHLQEKRILNLAAKEDLPPEITNRKKQAIQSPPWYSLIYETNGGEFLREMINGSTVRNIGVFNPHLIRQLKFMHRILPKSSRLFRMFDNFLGRVIGLHLLHEMMIKEPPPSDPNFSLQERKL